jgi:uncharacterized membrane protein YdbT with pleckstrin-like domain
LQAIKQSRQLIVHRDYSGTANFWTKIPVILQFFTVFQTFYAFILAELLTMFCGTQFEKHLGK